MGIMLTQYPELFGALVCQNPLLDMRRYHLLLAGASWTAEFGDPDDAGATGSSSRSTRRITTSRPSATIRRC